MDRRWEGTSIAHGMGRQRMAMMGFADDVLRRWMGWDGMLGHKLFLLAGMLFVPRFALYICVCDCQSFIWGRPFVFDQLRNVVF